MLHTLDHTKIPTKRLTISMPEYVYDRLKQEIPKGSVSQFVTESVQNKLLRQKIEPKQKTKKGLSPVEKLFALSHKMPATPWSEIKQAIEKGRM